MKIRLPIVDSANDIRDLRFDALVLIKILNSTTISIDLVEKNGY